MKKFIALYLTPVAVLDAWRDTDPTQRAEAEKKMQADWQAWMTQHGANIIETAGAGKTTRITTEGAMETKNDVMMYSLVQAESAEAATEMFKGHPHLGIPQASIDIMEARVLPGMH